MADSPPELKDLVNVLSHLDWGGVQAMGVQLGMKVSTFRKVESERNTFSERLQESMDSWLISDTVQPTWARVVTALRVSNKAPLANRVEREYCQSVGTFQSSEPAPFFVRSIPTPLDSTALLSSSSSKPELHTCSASSPQPKRLVQCNSPSPSTTSTLSSSPSSSPKPSLSSSPSSPSPSLEMQIDHPIAVSSQPADLPGLLRELATSDQTKVNPVCSKVTRLERKFVSILTNTKILFSKKEAKSVNFLIKLRHTLTSIPKLSKFKSLKFLRAERKAINSAKNTDDIFTILDEQWNWNDYYLLQQLITEFGDSTLQKEMTCYLAKLHHFEKATTIQEISKAVDGWKCPRHFRKIVLTLKDEASKFTLYDVRRLKENLSSKAPLNDCIKFLLQSIHASEVVLTLAFPEDALEFIPPALNEDFIEKFSIKSIILDDMPLTAYTEEYVKVSINTTFEHVYCGSTVI